MNTSNIILRILMAVLIGLTLSTFTSCQTDGCTNIHAENYDPDADNDDGSCILSRDKFIGSYNVNENCDSGNWNYSISVTASTTAEDAIVIGNFGDYAVNLRATVSGANITFNDTQDGITFSGTGNISGNTLTIIYSASAAGQTDNCTKTCIKQ